MPWSPLHGGILAGVLKKEREGKRRHTSRAKDLLKERPEQVQAYEDFCDEIGKEPASVGLAWLLHQPAVTSPIVGPRTMEQLESATEALDVKLSEEELAQLDEIWPGHKTAPEDYAW